MTDGLKTIKKLSLFQPFKDSASGRPQWKSNPKEERKEETFDRVSNSFGFPFKKRVCSDLYLLIISRISLISAQLVEPALFVSARCRLQRGYRVCLTILVIRHVPYLPLGSLPGLCVTVEKSRLLGTLKITFKPPVEVNLDTRAHGSKHAMMR